MPDKPLLDVDELRAALRDAHDRDESYSIADLPPTLQANLRLEGIESLEELHESKTGDS